MVRFCVICTAIFYCLSLNAQIQYPNFDQSMLRMGMQLDRIDPKFDEEAHQLYKARNHEVVAFFRELYYTNIAKAASEKKKLRIPRIIHQIWLGSAVPERFLLWMRTWMRLEGWEYRLWTEKEIDELSL